MPGKLWRAFMLLLEDYPIGTFFMILIISLLIFVFLITFHIDEISTESLAIYTRKQGKTTLARRYMEKLSHLSQSITCTDRLLVIFSYRLFRTTLLICEQSHCLLGLMLVKRANQRQTMNIVVTAPFLLHRCLVLVLNVKPRWFRRRFLFPRGML